MYTVYIKKVYKKNKGSEKKYTYWHLVDCLRTEKGPRQRLVLNLGRVDLPDELRPELASSIEDLLAGRQKIIRSYPEVERLSQIYTNRIVRKRQVDTPTKKELVTVDINSISCAQCRTIGAEYVGYTYWSKLGLTPLLKDLGFSKKEIDIATLLTIGRLVYPASERATLRWAKSLSGLDELIGCNFSHISKKILYKVGDRLLLLKYKIEAHLASTEANLFNLKEKIILYDITNTYLEGRALSNSKACFGKSKEKRSDAKLVALGLVVDGKGFPKASCTYKGNITEHETFKDMVEVMLSRRENKDENPTIVIDAGIATRKNILWLLKKNLNYTAVYRGKFPVEIDLSAPLTLIRKDEGKDIKIEVVKYPGEDETYLLCKSRAKEKKEESIKSRIEKILLEKLQNLSKRIKTGKIKAPDKIYQKIGRLKEKYSKVAQYYDISLKEGKLNYTRRKDIIEKPSGTYLLRTNRSDLAEEEIWSIYSMIVNTQDSFRCLKSELGIRPVYHQKEGRVDSHIFISVLAYHLLHSIEENLKQRGDCRSWKTIREVLSSHTRVTVNLASENGLGYHIRVCTTPEKEHLEIYNNLELDPVPISRRSATFRL